MPEINARQERGRSYFSHFEVMTLLNRSSEALQGVYGSKLVLQHTLRVKKLRHTKVKEAG